MGIFPADRPKPKGFLDALYNVYSGLSRDIPAVAGSAASWFGEQARKSPEQAQADVRGVLSAAPGFIYNTADDIAKKAIGSAAEFSNSGIYDPAPIVDAAMLPMGGPAAKVGEVILNAGKKATPLLGVLHGSGSPAEFKGLLNPPPTHDLGIHTAIEPSITHGYATKHGYNLEEWPYVVQPGGKEPKVDFVSKMRFDDPAASGPRTKSYLLDADGTLKYPVDAGKWNNPWSVINPIEDDMRRGIPYPRGLLEDLHNISGSNKIWQEQFMPMMQDRGINHLFYPHAGSNRYDAFMTFDPKHLTPRYTEEGIKLAEERGVVEPIGHASRKIPGSRWEEKPWVAPRGIMHKPQEGIETLTRIDDPKKNTFKWWGDDAPPSKIKEISDKTHAEYTYHKAHDQYNQDLNKLNMDHTKGKVSDDEFIKQYNELKANKPAIDPQYSSHYYGDKGTAEEAVLKNKSIGIMEELDKQYNKGKITKEQYWEEAKKANPNGNDFYPLPYVGQMKENTKLFENYLGGKINKEDFFKEHQVLHQYDKPKDVIYHSDKEGKYHKIYKTPEAEKFHTQMDTLQSHYDEGTINTESYKEIMKKLKDDYHGKSSTVNNSWEAAALNKSPPEGGMSLAGKYDKLLNDLDDGIISKAQYDQEVAKLHNQVPTPHDSPLPNPHSPKGTWTAAPPPKSILNNPELYGGSPDPNIAAKKLQDDIAASTKNYNIDFKAALEYFQNFKKKKD